MSEIEEFELGDATLSAALAAIFRGKLCDAVLRNRPVMTIPKDRVLYDIGDKDRTLFFIQDGIVKIGTITEAGQELIYDVRKGGDVVGELCASGHPRRDRAVALEASGVIAVSLDEVFEVVKQDRDLLLQLVQVFCSSLSDAYDQLNSVAFSNTVHRMVKVLIKLATQLGRISGTRTEISSYITQEEIAKMAAVRRERASTAMNVLRKRGIISYSRRGRILVDLPALENYGA